MFLAIGEEGYHLRTFDGGCHRSPHLNLRVVFLDAGHGGPVKIEILRLRSRPHLLSSNLIPDLDMADVVVEPIGPAVVVVPQDVDADLCPFLEVLRRSDVEMGCLVFDAHAHPEKDGGPVLNDGLDIGIGLSELVILRIVGIQMKQREDRGDIDDIGVRPVAIVQAHAGESRFLVERHQIARMHAHGSRPTIHPVESLQGSDTSGEINLNVEISSFLCC